MPAGVANYMSAGTDRFTLNGLELAPGLVWAVEVREEVTAGGIVLPDVDDAQKVRIACCFAIGPGEADERGNEKRRFVKAGDFFLFGKYQSGGEPIKINGVTVLQFRQGDIVAKLLTPTGAMRAAADKARGPLFGEQGPTLAAVA